MERLSESFDFRVHWKPYLLNADMPEEGIPLEQYFRHKFGEEAAQRFWSDKSPLMQSGKAVVSLKCLAWSRFCPSACVRACMSASLLAHIK